MKDSNQEAIEGDFYENDLQKVDKNEKSLWMMEKIIQKRKRKSVTELLVKFESWSVISGSKSQILSI